MTKNGNFFRVHSYLPLTAKNNIPPDSAFSRKISIEKEAGNAGLLVGK